MQRNRFPPSGAGTGAAIGAIVDLTFTSKKSGIFLPAQMTTFIGREKEIKEIREALSKNRLVTLTGSGGAGKTRLSLETAHACLFDFPDGIFFVALAPLDDPSLILPAIVQALGYARTPASSLDEGAYLYKGYLFATGQYRPFELNGPQTNKSPLAFLIPGFAELIFGSGLRTGRMLAVVFGMLTVILVGWIAYRLAGKWLAAAAVWALALNPVLIKTYSEGVSQSEVAFTLALMLALCLGEDRPSWQLALSGFLLPIAALATAF